MNYLIEIQYFGCITFFQQAALGKYLILEQSESYQKMSFRNRCQVLAPDKVLNLTVPLQGGRDQKGLTASICIDYSLPWQMQHWRTLESCYNNSPFFLYYKDQLQNLIFEKHDTLWDRNLSAIRWVLSRLKLSAEVTFTDSFKRTPDEGIMDLRNVFKPANRAAFGLPVYQQVFDLRFEPNLSILDVLFNLGPSATDYLRKQPAITTLIG